MPIKKSTKKSTNKPESSLAKIKREREEREKIERKMDEEKTLADKLERERKHKIIREHLSKLESQLSEKRLDDFWVFADRSGFKRFHGTTAEIKKMTKSNPKKYANRMVAHYVIRMFHKSPDTDLFRKLDKWMNLGITLYTTDDTGDMLGKYDPRECKVSWSDSDFELGKLSVKLMESLLKPLADKSVSCASISGLTLGYIVDHYKKNAKVDLSDILQPLKKLM